MLIEFLRTGALRHPNLREQAAPKHYFRFLAELFAFAGRFDAYAFRNAVLDAFFTRIARKEDGFPYESIRDVYECTKENSSLRDLVITIVINIGTSDELQAVKEDLPRTFLVDCLAMAAEDGIVPFRKSGRHGKGFWLDEKKDSLCVQYHVHSKEELRDAEERKDEKVVAAEERPDEEMGGVEEEEEKEASYVPSEKTMKELQFIEDLKKLRVRY